MRIFGLCGEKSSGKNTFANYARTILDKVGIPTAEAALADPLKRFCMDYLGLPHSSCYGTEDQKNASFSTWGQIFSPKIYASFDKTHNTPISAREILQVVGTEVFRGSFQPSFWVDLMVNSTLPDFNKNVIKPVVFVTDVRFPNEVDKLKMFGAKIVRIRRNIDRVQQIPHASELEMAKIPETEFSHVVFNNGPMSDLEKQVWNVLEVEGLI